MLCNIIKYQMFNIFALVRIGEMPMYVSPLFVSTKLISLGIHHCCYLSLHLPTPKCGSEDNMCKKLIECPEKYNAWLFL
jgi:hypothetical protein